MCALEVPAFNQPQRDFTARGVEFILPWRERGYLD